MFTQNMCMVHHCRNIALSTFDKDGNITDDKSYCIDHTPNPGLVKENIYKYISNHDKIVGLNASGMIFTGIDFSNKKFFGCNFQHCTFININSENLLARMSIFDFAVFNDCNMIKSNMIFNSFSGCTFTHTLFTSSDIIQDNLNGIKAFQSSFDNSDLYNSRFINATLVDTSFRNCNLKKTLFYTSKRTNVSFKLSNTREAEFTRNGSALLLGKDLSNEELCNT